MPYVVAGLILCGGAAVGCDINIKEGKASVGMFSAEATDQWTHRYPLGEDGRFELVNVNGPMNVSAGDAGAVQVQAFITAKALTDAGAREMLTRGRIQEVAEPAHVHIETMAPRGLNGSYSVRYEVKVPPRASVDLASTNGDVTASGLTGKTKTIAVNGRATLDQMTGAIDAVVANGSLTVGLSSVTAPVRLEVTNGRLGFSLPATSKANLSARVVNGGITVSGLAVEQTGGRRIRNLDAMLNGGGQDVALRMTNGRITIEGK
jgi:hypothetical protein